MRDCRNVLREAGSWSDLMEDASEYEQEAILAMGKLCQEMAEMFEDFGPYVEEEQVYED